MKKSFAAALLVLSLALGAAAPAAVRAEEIGPGIGLEEKIAAQQAAAQAAGSAGTEETAAPQSDAPEDCRGTAGGHGIDSGGPGKV